MPTIKLVVIGSSGVGKTSLRGKYISGRFSNGYRATIGADFITKTLPHPTNPGQSVTLQIWDTAGQERFSSLSSAFFRGADAALLMFDVNTPETMQALRKWWDDFCDRAPLADEDINDYCCVVVGNKIDMIGSGKGVGLVSETEALEFLDELIPSRSRSPSIINVLTPATSYQDVDDYSEDDGDTISTSQQTVKFTTEESSSSSQVSPNRPSHLEHRSHSIAITPSQTSHSNPMTSYSPKHQLSKSRSRSSSRFYGGTMTTTHTTLTIYHTPSSSVFDVYQSARSSPEPRCGSSPRSEPTSPTASYKQRRLTMRSTGSTSSGSAATITPRTFARADGAPQVADSNVTTVSGGSDDCPPPSTSSSAPPLPPPPEHGPKLFFTSAKTGKGVADVFEYIAQRVMRKWEYDELLESRRMHYREASAAETIRLGLDNGSRKSLWMDGRRLGDCCAS
ncbi:P-loop containing nucleoside triphosphate hydrolase protein [Crassisporium funariophilum]|nr:P-loop containing nucleoside triphosphate hydrolase protein [Crassisporium funariophilum]